MTAETGPAGFRFLDALESLCLVLAGTALTGVICAQGWQVFARYVLNAPPSWTDPISITLMAFAAMFGAAVGARKGSHFAFTGLGDALPASMAAGVRFVGQLCMVATGLALAGLGGALTVGDWSVKMAGAPLPAGVQYAPLAIGGALIALFSTERALATLARKDPKP